MIDYRAEVVFGWGAVERRAEIWCPGAKVEEVRALMWTVRAPDGALLGAIGKSSWDEASLRRRLAEMVAAGEVAP